MKMKLAGSLAVAATILAGIAFGQAGQLATAMRLTSPAFPDGSVIPDKYTQAKGQPDVSPELNWSGAPAATVTFVLLLHDPDLAINKRTDDGTHWIVWNIPGTATKLDEAIKEGTTLPDGTIQGKNRSGKNAYFGPGAPATAPEHHYTFELFALDTKLDLGPDTPRADVFNAIQGHILAKAVYEGRFHLTAK